MARENQGLQITLIVFVILTILLSVTTYVFYRQYDEWATKAKVNLEEATKKGQLATKNEEDANELKRLLGVAKTEKVDAIASTVFADDMKKYGGSYPEDARFYRPLLEKMGKTIDEKNAALAQADAKIHKLEEDFRVREANKQPQIDELKKAADDASKDLAGERSKFQGERDRITQESAKLKADLDTARKTAETAMGKVKQDLQNAVKQYGKLKDTNSRLGEELQARTATKFDVPTGEVRWANQRSGTVWINLGDADSLQRQVTFSVFPANISDLTSDSVKGSIEVTRVLGDHLAEARITSDKPGNPIMPGDKIYTPVWSRGEKRHFAIAGKIDLDGDGTNDIQTLIDLIRLNGGEVDTYLNDKDKRVGHMTINTRFLVIGEAPTDTAKPAVINDLAKIRSEAQQLGVQKVGLPELLQRMGWKNESVVHYGLGSNPSDFAPKSNDASRSSGNPFESRTPPSKNPSGGNGTYYKFHM
ncbi:MAG: hypothetical protein LLF97_10485 [Planctomycetaceae bacterium]|nr:hypothetical protein [Planctomycetaceae bacterium]